MYDLPVNGIVKYTYIYGVYARQRRRRRLASSNTINAPNPHHGQNAAVLLSRTYVFAAFDSRWPGIAFLILALSGNLALCPYGPPHWPFLLATWLAFGLGKLDRDARTENLKK